MRVRYLATATVLILAAVLAACGSGSGEQTEPVEQVATSAQVGTTAQVATSASATAATTVDPTATTVAEEPPPAPTTGAPEEQPDYKVVTTTEPEPTAATEPVAVAAPEGPRVPAITLELDDGSTFVTTDATRPVLYVFWAEW